MRQTGSGQAGGRQAGRFLVVAGGNVVDRLEPSRADISSGNQAKGWFLEDSPRLHIYKLNMPQNTLPW
jgi:hypothetical protein